MPEGLPIGIEPREKQALRGKTTIYGELELKENIEKTHGRWY